MLLVIALVLAAIWLACLSDGRKTVYRLTSEGIDPAPVLVEMIIWATRHEETEAPPDDVRDMERNRSLHHTPAKDVGRGGW